MKVPTLAALILCGAAQGAVYNVTIMTDNVPDYTTIDTFIDTATSGLSTDEEKCKAVWRWACLGRRQTGAPREDGRTLWDPILFFNSYGYTYCGYISGINDAVWNWMGYDTTYVQIDGHTISEVLYDAEYHMFDTAGNTYCIDKTGAVASCEEIAAKDQGPENGFVDEDGYVGIYRCAPECATHPDGWRSSNSAPMYSLCRDYATRFVNLLNYSSWADYGRLGHTYVLNLRTHEHYTRYWEPQDDAQNGGDTTTNDPDYFRPMSDGDDPDDEHGFNNIRGNGIWVFEPDLSTNEYRDLVFDEANVESFEDSGATPNLHPSAAATTASVAFKIYPANVAASARVEATGKRAGPGDSLKMLVSRDCGLNWTEVWQATTTGTVTVDENLRDYVAGAWEFIVKFEMTAAADKLDCGLDALKITTITQVNRRALPRLTLGTNTVQFRLGEQVETQTTWPVLHGDAYKNTIADESGVQCTADESSCQAVLRPDAAGVTGHVTWLISAPTDIMGVEYWARFWCRTDGDLCHMLHSWDGASFTQDIEVPAGKNPDMTTRADGNYRIIIAEGDVPGGQRDAWLKYDFTTSNPTSGWWGAGLCQPVMRVKHKPRNARFYPVEVTYCWTEHRNTGDVTRTHTELVTTSEHEWTINVAGFRDPTMNWLRVNLAGHGPDGDAVQYGYSDATDVGTGYEPARVVYNWGTNVAEGRTYAATPAPDAHNPDTSGEDLTDGVICPHSTSCRESSWPQMAVWGVETNPSITVDLGSVQAVEGVRAWTRTAQYERENGPFDIGHPEEIEVLVSTDGISFASVGTMAHDDIWTPPADYLPWEHEDDPDYDNVPERGKLSYGYPLVFASQNARYVRFDFTTRAGEGVAVHELQVFDAASTVTPPDAVFVQGVSTLAMTASGAPLKGDAALTVDFDATASGGTGPYAFAWDFGDGNASAVEDPQNIYANPGVYRATVVASDSVGACAWAEVRVAVTQGGGQSISGTVTGDVQQGVTLTLSRDEDATTVSAAGGGYSFTGLAPGSYLVTPTLAGYVFVPESRDVTLAAGEEHAGVDFVAHSVYTVSGTVTGDVEQGLTLTLSGDGSGTTVTAADGSYSFLRLVNGDYTVTPSLAGYAFIPASQDVTVNGADVGGIDFTSHIKYSISGTVTGDVQQGVTLTLSGDASETTVSAADGTYTLQDPINGSYTVTPSLAGYVFTPPSRDVTVSGADVTGVDFVATAVYTISGVVTGDVQQGVTMTLSGDASNTAVTDSGGNYSFDLLPNGSYAVEPSLVGYYFVPTSWSVRVNGADEAGIDFVSHATSGPVRDISGSITGDVQEGVALALSGDATATTTSAADGSYSFSALYDGAYVVTPSLAGYTFTPATWGVTVSGADVAGIDFAAQAVGGGGDGDGGGCGGGPAAAMVVLFFIATLRRKRKASRTLAG